MVRRRGCCFLALVGAARGADPVPALAAGSPNAALVAALGESNHRREPDTAAKARVAELLSPPADLMQMARSMGLMGAASGPIPPPSSAPSCSTSASLLNSAADLMEMLRQPHAQRLMVEMGRDERALQWVMERTRESMANPSRFLELLAHPSTANLLTALRADAGLLPRATKCGEEEKPKGKDPKGSSTPRREVSVPSANGTAGERTANGTAGEGTANGTARERTADGTEVSHATPGMS